MQVKWGGRGYSGVTGMAPTSLASGGGGMGGGMTLSIEMWRWHEGVIGVVVVMPQHHCHTVIIVVLVVVQQQWQYCVKTQRNT